jgi:Putative polyhydroxyalkanoic acid system protein (PHA_gran_rgn)
MRSGSSQENHDGSVSESSEQDKDQQDDDDESKPTAAVISRAIEWSAADAAKAPKQRNDQDDKKDCSDGHKNFLQPISGNVRKQTVTRKVPVLAGGDAASFFPAKRNYMPQGKDSLMPAPLIVSIPHSLGREAAIRRLKAGLTRAVASVPVLAVEEERWEDNRMAFRLRALGQVATGHLDVAEDHVRLEVTLPWLLQRFAEFAQAAIKKRGNLLLTKR